MALPPETRESILAVLRDRLQEKRLRHVLGVTDTILTIAAHEGLDAERAETAALLHDLCRNFSNDEMLQAAANYGIAIDGYAALKPMLLHGPVAAEESKRIFGIDDPEVYEAVYVHTTGMPGMGLIARALYVADFSEPSRRYPEATRAREIFAAEGLHSALLYVAAEKTNNHARTASLDPNTRAFLEWLREGCDLPPRETAPAEDLP